MAELLHVDASVNCLHQGRVTIISSNTRVKVSGEAVATVNDTYTVTAGTCIFTTPAGTPHPCVKVQWIRPASRVFVNGQPVVLKDSTGICLAADQAPQGAPNVAVTQMRVKGT